VPGPNVATEKPQLFWGVIASMWLGNVMLLILNLPLVGIWVRLLMIPYRVLFPTIIAFSAIGVFTVSNAEFDVFMLALFGVVGYVFLKLGCEPAPFLLGFVLGPMLETHLRRAMILSNGDATVFLTHPISGGLLAAAALVLVIVSLPAIKKKRDEIFEEES
jgi:TctA family transporter